MKKKLEVDKLFLILVSIVVLGLVVGACSSKKEKTVLTTPENSAQSIEDSDVLQFDQDQLETEEGANQYSSGSLDDYNDSLFLEDEDNLDIPADLLAKIRQALLEEDYPGVLRLVESRDDDASTYYRGIAYFVMMQEEHKYDEQERLVYARNAETILKDVAENTGYDGLRTRALLWYSVTLQTQYSDFNTLKTAVGNLYKIKNYPNSRVYNDSVYYMGNVHAKMGWYGPARYYYKKVRDLNQNGDNRIYDYTDKTFYSLPDASEAGLDRLGSYMDGTHKDYR